MFDERIAAIVEAVADDALLDAGVHPHAVLAMHYARMERRKQASEASLYRDARRRVAFAPVSFIVDVAKAVGTSVKSLVRLFKDRVVLKLFNKFGWSFDRMLRALKDGAKDLKEVAKSVYRFIKENGVTGATIRAGLWVEDWLKEYPKFSRYGVGVILLAAWFLMAFSGDTSYDFDVSEAIDAFAGHLSLATFIASPDGVKFMSLLAMGALTGGMLSYPWPGSTTAQFIVTLVTTLMKYVGIGVQKALQPPESEAEALGIA
jgi:hypothetical protein